MHAFSHITVVTSIVAVALADPVQILFNYYAENVTSCSASTQYKMEGIGFSSECHSLENPSYAFNIRGQQVPEFCDIVGYVDKACTGDVTLQGIIGPSDPSQCYTASNANEPVNSVLMICM